MKRKSGGKKEDMKKLEESIRIMEEKCECKKIRFF